VDVQVTFADRTPILTLSGRFDGFGALQFDEAAQGIAGDASFWILDFAGVSFISSIGLRSIVELEKRLRARDGGLILVAIARSIRQLLEISRLDSWLRLVATTDEAMAMARAASSAAVTSHEVSGRAIRLRRVAPTTSTIECGKARRTASSSPPRSPISASHLASAALAKASPTRAQGSGAFVSTPLFAGVLPATAHGVSDFITGGVSATMPVHVHRRWACAARRPWWRR
jgi:anti-anti-sigma factor